MTLKLFPEYIGDIQRRQIQCQCVAEHLHPAHAAAQAPFLVFSLVYVWGSLVLGQVNLFTLAGLLLALGSIGLGLAAASPTAAPRPKPSSNWPRRAKRWRSTSGT